jgi:hypothetical protein
MLFTEDSPSFWRANGLVFGFALIVAVLSSFWSFLADTAFVSSSVRVTIGLIVSCSPAAIWLVSLYQGRFSTSDSVRPYVTIPMIMIVGAFFSGAISHPILTGILHVGQLLSEATPTDRFTGTILIYGMVHVYLTYTAIRIVGGETGTLCRRVEGLVFGLAFSLGYGATFASLFVLDNGGLTLFTGNLRLMSTVVAFCVNGLAVGFVAGTFRFEQMPVYFLPLGLSVCAILHGILLYIGTQLNIVSLSLADSGFSPWPGYIVSVLALAAGIFVAFTFLRQQSLLIRGRIRTGLQ